MLSSEDHARIIRTAAIELGFGQVGFARAERLDEAADRLEKWLLQGNQGSMSYMTGHFEKRVDPRELVPDAKTVVSLSYNYFSEEGFEDPSAPKVSMYAYGRDYHKVIKKKLKSLIERVREEIGDISGRCFVDSAPVMEREWAQRSGIGWNGKNTLTINPKSGSYFFLAELIIDLEVAPDQAMRDHCGTCTRCIDACPTGAIADNGYWLDASKCISYLTIELKDRIPEEFRGKMDGWIFGCDVCQQVCPWNRFSKQHDEPAFVPSPQLLKMTEKDWTELTREVFDDLFTGSAVKRTGYEGLSRNIRFLQSGD